MTIELSRSVTVSIFVLCSDIEHPEVFGILKSCFEVHYEAKYNMVFIT
jgi:hypothetical protein